jgi:hypothetical protein
MKSFRSLSMTPYSTGQFPYKRAAWLVWAVFLLAEGGGSGARADNSQADMETIKTLISLPLDELFNVTVTRTNTRYNLEHQLPKTRAGFRADHHAGHWRLTGAVNYFGAYSADYALDGPCDGKNIEQYRGELIFDAEVGYRQRKNWRFVAGI